MEKHSALASVADELVQNENLAKEVHMSREHAEKDNFYQDSIVIDGLVTGPTSSKFVQELVGAGITAGNWTVASHQDDTLSALNRITQFYWLLEQHPQSALLVEKTADIERAKKDGKLGIVLGFQGAGPLGHNVHLIRVFHRLGVRVIGLTYNEGNAYAAGCTEPANGGLTSLGIQAVQEMNRIGVVIDLSHVGERSSLQAIDISEDPVVFTHSNPFALQPNPRNVTDEQMRACAAKRGVIGLATFSAFVGDTAGGRQPSLNEFFRQIDYALDLVGPDHVAIGTDSGLDPTDGVWWHAVTGRLYPEVSQGMTARIHNIAGFEMQTDFPLVAQAMLNYGYEEKTMRQILGQNWLRVFGQVWGG
jgi:membrane dipeptidase